jgi:hypothetical protein
MAIAQMSALGGKGKKRVRVLSHIETLTGLHYRRGLAACDSAIALEQ